MKFRQSQLGPNRAAILVAMLATLAGDRVYAQCNEEPVFTDPMACSHLWEEIGLPNSLKDEGDGDFVLICHHGYITRYNTVTKIPDWVIQRLTKEMVSGTNRRPGTDFKPDPCVDEGKSAVDPDYKFSDFARGHQAASSDYKFDREWMKDTFFFSNAVPQVGAGFNTGIWHSLEKKVQKIAKGRDEIYVVTGPVYRERDGSDMIIPAQQNACENEIVLPAITRKEICGGTRDNPNFSCGDEGDGVEIPIALYKIIYDPDSGRVNAYIIPNMSHSELRVRGESSSEYLSRWRVSVMNIEERIEYNFSPQLSERETEVSEQTCAAMMHR